MGTAFTTTLMGTAFTTTLMGTAFTATLIASLMMGTTFTATLMTATLMPGSPATYKNSFFIFNQINQFFAVGCLILNPYLFQYG